MIWLTLGIIGAAIVLVVAPVLLSGRIATPEPWSNDEQMEAMRRMRPARRPPERSEGGDPIIKGTGDVDAYEEHA